ncbi:MAG: uridine kinase [Bacteroidetes bacterium]|nr:uridine kinase [Bacteroidota bacterium]
MTPKLIAISGGSGSGKTYFVNKISELLDASKLLIIPLDNYYRDQSHLTINERINQNYDQPDSLDFSLLLQHLTDLKNGKSIKMPEYDFTIHTRKQEMKEVDPKEIMIIEGILTLEYEHIRDLAELKIYIETPDDIKFIRRLQRDTEERGRSVESVINQYLDTVRPMFLRYILPTKEYADIIIDGTQYNPTLTKELLQRLL